MLIVTELQFIILCSLQSSMWQCSIALHRHADVIILHFLPPSFTTSSFLLPQWRSLSLNSCCRCSTHDDLSLVYPCTALHCTALIHTAHNTVVVCSWKWRKENKQRKRAVLSHPPLLYFPLISSHLELHRLTETQYTIPSLPCPLKRIPNNCSYMFLIFQPI